MKWNQIKVRKAPEDSNIKKQLRGLLRDNLEAPEDKKSEPRKWIQWKPESNYLIEISKSDSESYGSS
jgi:hypothetical protein